MTQLIGYEIWNAAHNPSEDVPAEAVVQGITAAQRISADLFLGPILERLSGRDQDFLIAMLEDPTETSVSDIATRAGMSAKQVSAYRSRLINKGMIAPKRYGYVAFVHSGVRRWLAQRVEEESNQWEQPRWSL